LERCSSKFYLSNIKKVLKDSKFTEKGVLTPQEFVIAGDHLVGKFPTWEYSLI